MIPRRPARAPARACGPRFPRGWYARTAPALAPPADSGSGRSTRRCALGLEAPEPGLELIEVPLVLHRRPEPPARRSEEHTSELQSRLHLVCRLLLEKKKHHDTTT